ncbi:hypothetical protein Tco_0762673 [Tanacetum coccineum]
MLHSGLKVNIAKIRLYGAGVSRLDLEVVVSSLGCDHGSLSFFYLGLPVGSKMNRVMGWNEVVNRVRAPMKILNLLESIRSIFLGFQRFRAWNLVGNALWHIVISEFYRPDGGFGDTSCGGYAIGGVWVNILNFVKRVGNTDISFKKSFILKIGPFGKTAADGMATGLGVLLLKAGLWTSLRVSLPVFVILPYSQTGLISGHGRRASLDRLPSRANMSMREVELSSTFGEKSGVGGTWLLPCLFSLLFISDVVLGNISSSSNTCSRLSKVMQGVFECTLWVIWKWRNEIVNSHSDVSSMIKDEDIFLSTQRFSKTWISAWLSNLVNWNVWIATPFDLFD